MTSIQNGTRVLRNLLDPKGLQWERPSGPNKPIGRENMPFIASDKLPKMELFPGALSGIVSGEHLMLSFLEMEEGSEVPEHSHPHEQAGMVLSGKLKFKIGSEERLLGVGDAFIVLPNVVHSGVVVEGPARVLDIFTPPREDYIDQYNKYTSTSVQTRWK
jgi:quercetin dioxygenase-like cupin family protein